jgi:hypothetical protein
LLHFQLNNPVWPDAQPWNIYLLAVVAIVIVILNRRMMFSREASVFQDLLPENAGGGY